MKEVYDIDTGEIKYAYPSRRDPGIYETPARTTHIHPPTFDKDREYIQFRNGQWRIYQIGNTTHYRILQDSDLDPMKLLREERDKRLKEMDLMFEKFETNGLAIPNQLIDYRADLRNVPQHVEFGLVDKPQIISGKLVFNDWPIPPRL